ncbi:class I SAM-dependent methyltransferase [Brochothrix campestris]|uniref:S-adenosylmethionine (SAM)-dependent methyltransferase n=1 Tax=Brochothrix campestris FSL F6-1037 TaxID=1265861 RepID=W7CNW0_9LIST|nr:class I SAM-dependent methyltransferase [Brochothrix campestris]EUJ37331.1 S-adenosylmethionine (SAM)-dependent methyltransferase [Brochothrix campestris FSL F6-1037]
MILKNALSFSHYLLQQKVQPGNAVIDATIGNGHDTLFLAQLIGQKGHLIGCDIQEAAVEATRKRLADANISLASLTLSANGHEQITQLVDPQLYAKLTAAIFNLGYLPGGDKTITTTTDSTLSAVKQLLKMMPSGGLVVLTVYYGHHQGKLEKEALHTFTNALPQADYAVLNYQFTNQKNDPPMIIAIEIK